MPRNLEYVPYGYEPPATGSKGTLIYYDLFEPVELPLLEDAVKLMHRRSFSRLVLYPLHEETAKRMFKGKVRPFYKRERELEEWMMDKEGQSIVLESFESKRRKYTPMDTALRHLVDKYNGPYFVLLTGEMANAFASFSSFEDWIVKLRLILLSEPQYVHPRLEKYWHRWDLSEDERG